MRNMDMMRKELGIKKDTSFKLMKPPNVKLIRKEQGKFSVIKEGHTQIDLQFWNPSATTKGIGIAGGSKYLLTIIDMYTKRCDFEPMVNKTSASVINALQKIINRKILYPNGMYPKSIQADLGSEFNSELFKKYCYDNNIILEFSRAARKKQQAYIEGLNNLTSQLLAIRSVQEQKKIEDDTKRYNTKPWHLFLDKLRLVINKDIKLKSMETIAESLRLAKVKKWHKIGDMVHVIVEKPINYQGVQQTNKFRNGDYRFSNKAYKIVNIMYYRGGQQPRYKVDGFPNNTFTYSELVKA